MKAARCLATVSLVLCAVHAAAQVTPSPLIPKTRGDCKTLDNVDDCVVRVTITEQVDADRTNCKVDLSDPGLGVVGIKRGVNVILVWRIDKAPPGYGFADYDGIDFVNDPPARQFAWPGRYSGASPSPVFWWTDKNNRLRANYYEYEINVRNADGSVRCYVPDRWIKNQ